jgi:hypothetical protein
MWGCAEGLQGRERTIPRAYNSISGTIGAISEL